MDSPVIALRLCQQWLDGEQTKVGYEILFDRHFCVFKPPRDLAAIEADLKVVTDRIPTMIGGLSR